MRKILLALVVLVGFGGAAAVAQTKVAHVNSQTLLDTLPSRNIAIQKLQEFEVAGYEELKEMEADLQKAFAAYEAKKRDLSPVLQKIEEEKIMKKQQALGEREQELNVEMQAYSNELNAPILERVQKAIQIVSERKKLNYVIDASVALYVAGGTDITEEVVVELLKLDAAASAQ